MRMFFKIFLIFWLSNAAVFAGAFLLHELWERDDWEHNEDIQRDFGRTAAEAWERGGRMALNGYLHQLRSEHHVSGFLLNEQGQSLGRPLPPGVSKLIGEVNDGDRHIYIPPWDNPNGRYSIDAVRFCPDGKDSHDKAANDDFIFVLLREKRWGEKRDRFRGGFVLWLLAIAVASGLIAWLFIRPVRELQGATRQLAEGDLEARVPERTSKRRDALGDLGREFDRMASRIADLLESQRRLLRDVSHELRSPLARIQVALALAENRSKGGEAELERIGSELERLDALIGQVLTLTRLESGVDELERSEVGLAELAREVADDAAFEGSMRDVTVTLEDGDGASVHADRDKLRSALDNVVRNALRYTAEGSEVSIRVVPDESPELCCLLVRDRGPGVPDADLPRLFDAFYRCGEARDMASGGHGVGLAIVRSVVLAHGGSVSAENHPEGGLVISLCLPRA